MRSQKCIVEEVVEYEGKRKGKGAKSKCRKKDETIYKLKLKKIGKKGKITTNNNFEYDQDACHKQIMQNTLHTQNNAGINWTSDWLLG